jgi:hypothetical protein
VRDATLKGGDIQFFAFAESQAVPARPSGRSSLMERKALGSEEGKWLG